MSVDTQSLGIQAKRKRLIVAPGAVPNQFFPSLISELRYWSILSTFQY